MAEKPILFNTEMVRAILDGRKTQTRRVIRNLCLEPPYAEEDEGHLFLADEDGEFHTAETFSNVQRGDMLWVRETWAYNRDRWLYRADYPDSEDRSWARWRPSIHMPRDAARIFLRVTDVSAEKLQESFNKSGSTIFDFHAEGIDIGETCSECVSHYGRPCCIDDIEYDGNTIDECVMLDDIRSEFAKLWDSTIKAADRNRFGWAADPWVWVINFERLERDGE